MSVETQAVLIASLVILLAAAILSLRLRQISRSRWPRLLFVALVVLALRPLLLLVGLWTGAVSEPPAFVTELAGLAASALLLLTVAGVMRFLERARDDLEHPNQARAAERLTALGELPTSEERMRTMVENLPVLVEALDANGTLVMWNRECERVTGYSAAQMIGNPRAIELLYPDPVYRSEIEREFAQRVGHYRDWELTVTCQNGTQRIIAWSNVSGQPPIPGWRTWAIGVDVTERRRAEDAHRHAQELLEQRITERTAALQTANEALQHEIAERQNAEESAREQRALSEALRDTATALNSTLDLDEVLRRLLTNVGRVVPHDAANVMLIQEGIARVVLARGYAPRVPEERVLAISFRVAQTPHMRRMIETGHVQILSDVTADPDWIALPETQWIRSYAVAPIRLDDEVIGFLNLDSATPGAFALDQAEGLQAFADQAAVAVRNARLYQQTRQELTDRQRAEAAVRHSEQQLRTTLDALDDIVHVIGRDLRLILVNEAFRRWNLELGLATDPIGHTPFELFPFLPERARDDYRRAFETGEVVISEESTQVGAVTLFTETRKVPVFVEGRVQWVVTVMRDVTEQKRNAEALRHSQEHYRQSVENSPNPIFSVDRDGKIQTVNRACERILQIGQNVIGLPYTILLADPVDSARVDAMLRTVFQEKRALSDVDITYSSQDGATHWMLSRLYPVLDEVGQVQGCVFANTDITARRQAEEALRESQERYRIVSELVSDYAYSFRIEPDGTPVLEWMTEAFQRITGYTPDELLALGGWESLRHPEDVPLAQQRMRNLLAGQVDMTEYRIITRSGEVHWLRDYAQPIWDATEGRVVRFIGAAKDVTDRRQAERQALQLTLEQERGAILTNFIRDVSHEFANPLSVIKNDLYLITHAGDPESWQQRLENISDQIFHIERLVDGLMTMSRLDMGVSLLLEPLDVNRLVQTVLDGQASALQRQPHTIIRDLSPDLPPIQADQRYLYQALTKLVENAIQYTPSGGTIRLRTSTSGESVMIEVSDTGVGIAAEDLERIFGRFFRVDTARAQRGAGLGLTIARRVVELHGGQLQVESTPGAGSTFRVFLPIAGP
jgi:PAS domain S-box-containing protein